MMEAYYNNKDKVLCRALLLITVSNMLMRRWGIDICTYYQLVEKTDLLDYMNFSYEAFNETGDMGIILDIEDYLKLQGVYMNIVDNVVYEGLNAFKAECIAAHAIKELASKMNINIDSSYKKIMQTKNFRKLMEVRKIFDNEMKNQVVNRIMSEVTQ